MIQTKPRRHYLQTTFNIKRISYPNRSYSINCGFPEPDDSVLPSSELNSIYLQSVNKIYIRPLYSLTSKYFYESLEIWMTRDGCLPEQGINLRHVHPWGKRAHLRGISARVTRGKQVARCRHFGRYVSLIIFVVQ